LNSVVCISHVPDTESRIKVSADGRRIYVIGTTKPRLSRYDPNQRAFVPYLGGIAAFAVEFSPDRQWVSYITDGDSLIK